MSAQRRKYRGVILAGEQVLQCSHSKYRWRMQLYNLLFRGGNREINHVDFNFLDRFFLNMYLS